MADLIHRHNGQKRMHKQLGCMSSFLHIFDRQQIVARKRIHSTKRLPLSTSVGETASWGEFSQEPEKLEQEPDRSLAQCSKETVSIQTVDGDNNQWRSPNVVARLMGLESLSSYNQETQQMVKTSLPRVGSQSRVWRDPVHSKYIDGNNFQLKQPNQSHRHNVESVVRDERSSSKSESSKTMDEELEKRLKLRGMDEQINDLNALKQILQVLQLKGVLNSTSSRSSRDSNRNFVYDSNESLKQWRSLASKVDQHRSVNVDAGAVDNHSLRIPATASPNRIECNLKSCNSIIKRKPLSIEIQKRVIASSNSSTTSPTDSPKLISKKTGSVHQSITSRSPRHHRLTESSFANSPKQYFIKNVVTDDESCSISESSVKSPSTTISESSGWDGCRDGKILLERCGKLLHSIAEMNNATESPPSSPLVLPSPVSVLDSGFDKDGSSSPSYSIDFKASPAVDFDEDNWTTHIPPTQHNEHKEHEEIEHNEHEEHDEFISDDYDFIYISKILRATQHLRDDPTVFFSIEKHLHDYENTSGVFKSSKCYRKLVFDVISEMLDRNRQLSSWKVLIGDFETLVKQIWNEFRKIREMVINTGDGIDLLELINGVLKKEVEIKDWDNYPIETSEVILDVERLIFKDLVSEAIGDFVELSGECVFSRTRRKLVF